MTSRELKEFCLADSRLRSAWLDAYDAGLELATVRARIGFARHAGRTPDPDDEALEQFHATRFSELRQDLADRTHAIGLQTDPLTVDELVELVT